MSDPKRYALAVACAVAFLPGCAFGALTVYPEAASPGMVVRVTAEREVFRTERWVKIGGQPAALVRSISSREVDVLVPVVPPARVAVQGPGEEAGLVRVLPAPSLELVLSLRKSALTLVRATPRAGEVVGEASVDEPRLSFDIYNDQGGFVSSGSVVDPVRAGLEVLDGSGASSAALHGVAAPEEAFFAVKVPNVPGRFAVRFYEAPAGLDLTTERGREQRRFLNTVTVEGGAR